jgi:TorA maturation chaperone TorD
VGLARLRQAAYRLLSETFLPPTAVRPDDLCAASRAIRESCRWAADYAFYAALDMFLAAASSRSTRAAQGLAERYAALFGASSTKAPVPLGETAFLQVSEQSAGNLLVSLEQHYASSGVASSRAGLHMPDHISTELEFVSLLCGREAGAWDAGDFRNARRMQDRQRRFMENHPVRWLPALCVALEQRDAGVFQLAAAAARSLVMHDVDFLNAMRPYLRDGAVAASVPDRAQ